MNSLLNIKNLFHLSLVAILSVSISIVKAQGVFFSEYAEGSSNNKYLEIYNGTDQVVDLSSYAYPSVANGPATAGEHDFWNTFDDGASIEPGDVYVICHNSADASILVECDETFSYLSNGDDGFALVIGTESDNEVLDVIGQNIYESDYADPGSGWDVAGVSQATKDHVLVRKFSITEGNEDWASSAGTNEDDSEWIVLDIDTWDNLGSHTDLSSNNVSISGTWKLAPIAGALKVGPNPDDGSWWQSSAGDVDTRACFFDDEYVFGDDGSFQNVLGDETWLETWQGVEVDACGAPVAPHDGSADASFSTSETTVTISGLGAYIGLPKAITGNELSNEGVAVPDSRTYTVHPTDDGSLKLSISTGGGFWTFTLVEAGTVIETIDLTFNLDMSSVDNVSEEGVHIAGGGTFGFPGDNRLLDQDGDGIYTGTISVPVNGSSYYTFLNGGSDWNQKENIANQDCASPENYNDRLIEWGDEDVVINACFGLCGDGVCADLVPPTLVSVEFNVDANAYNEEQGTDIDTIYATGSFEGWSGYGVVLLDEDGDGVYTGSYEMVEGSEFEYKYVVGGWNNFQSGAELGSDCDWNPDDNYNNYGAIASAELELPVYIFGGGCAVRDGEGPGTTSGGLVIFDGIDTPEEWGDPFTWGGAQIFIEPEEGLLSPRSLAYIQQDEWSGGGFNISPPSDLISGSEWLSDSIHFLMLSGENSPQLRLQFESGSNGKVAINFTPNSAGGWHDYSFKLSDFAYIDGTSDFDTSAITVFQVLSEGNGAPGRAFLFNYIFTGAQIFGCTDSEALNYNPEATIDDGSCSLPEFADELIRTWKLAPFAGSMRVGDQGPGSGNWWSSGAQEHEARACLYDDEYVFNSDGTFQNILGDETWLETWQGVEGEGCGTPVAPHDGTVQAFHEISEFEDYLNVQIYGEGAFLGLAKAVNGGELSNGAELPSMREYQIIESGQNEIEIYIQIGETSFWTFNMVNSDWVAPELETIDITFNLDMSEVEEINESGVFVAGGGIFGGPGDNALFDEDNDGIYTGVVTVPANDSSYYTYLNGSDPSWSGKENIADQDCARPENWNDRKLVWGSDDLTVDACYGLCGDGFCADLVPPTYVEVTFNVSAVELNNSLGYNVDTLYATGSFEGWSGYGVVLLDEDGDEIYTGTTEIIEDSEFEYKYVLGGWGNPESGAEYGSECDWNPDDNYNNYGAVATADLELPVYIFGGGCEVWEEEDLADMLIGTWKLAPIEGALRVGPNGFGDGSWWTSSVQDIEYRDCFFDDEYVFGDDGSFQNVLGDETWLETWQGEDGQVEFDGCGQPIAPHDGGDFSYQVVSDDNDSEFLEIIVLGTGAYIGLPKAINGGELLSPADTVPNERYYLIRESGENEIEVGIRIDEADAFWTFTLVNSEWDEPEPEVCELVNCNNLQFVHVMESELIDQISTSLGTSSDEVFNMVVNGQIGMVVYDFDGFVENPDTSYLPQYEGRFMTEYNDLEDTVFYYVAEYPYGIPESRIHYYWVWGTYSEDGQFEGRNGEYISGDSENCVSTIDYGFYEGLQARYWDPMQYQSGWEHPTEFWNFDFWNSCEFDNGPSVVYFEKEDYADWTLAENQDRIKDNIWITRANRGHLFNIAIGDTAGDYSPSGTVWAQGSTEEQDSPENYGQLKDVVVDAFGGFNNIVGEVLSLYLLEYNEYYDVIFESWTSGNNGGGFSYTRYGVDAPVFEDDVVFLGSFDGSEYFQVNQYVSWEHANEIAMDFAPFSHLATLTHPLENEFVRDRLDWEHHGEYYIGLVDISQNGEGWSWVTGEPLDWVNWDEGQPDSPGNQNYGVLWSNGKWDDGDAEMPFIVEVPQEPVGIPVEVTACHPFHIDNGYDQNFFGVDIDNAGLFNSGDLVVVEQDGLVLTSTITAVSYPGDENCFDEQGDQTTAYIYIDDFLNGTSIGALMPGSIVYIGGYQNIEPVLASNYDVNIINTEAYFEGDTVGTLPALEIFDGLRVLINFESSSSEEPAAAQVALFYDSNMNDLLDPDDSNLFGEQMTVLLVDNDENDMHPDYGTYEELIFNEQDEFSPFMIQGAKFFMTALDANDSIIAVQPIEPYSMHTTRATGQAVDSDSVAIPGLIIQVAAGSDIYYGDFNFYAGVTDSNGYYDIGMSDLEEGDFFMGTDPNAEDFQNIYGPDSRYERYVTLFESDEYGWDTWFYGSFAESDGIGTLVNELNTLVTGQVLDPAGNPMPYASFIETETELLVSDSLIWVYTGDTESDEEGFYSFWSNNGSHTRISTYFDIPEYDSYDSIFVVTSDFYDEELGAFVYNHDIQLPLPYQGEDVDIVRNGGFEDGLNYWSIWTQSNNWAIDVDGAPIYQSDSTLSVYEGEYALKLWGQYNNDGENWTDVGQLHQNIMPGALISASAMMMSHQDDWIGLGPNSDHAGTNEVVLYISFWDHDGNWISSEVSNPFDGNFSPSDWHRLEVEAVVPEGAHDVWTGVAFHQRDMSNGSVYIDDFQATSGSNFIAMSVIEGRVFGEFFDEDMGYWDMDGLPNTLVEVYSEYNYYTVTTDPEGFFSIEVPGNDLYYINVPNPPGMITSSFPEVYAGAGDFNYVEVYCYALENQYFIVEGHVLSQEGFGLFDVRVEFFDTSEDTATWWNVHFTDPNGYFGAFMPYGTYDMRISLPAHESFWIYGLEVDQDIYLDDIILNLVTEFDGSVQGVVSFITQDGQLDSHEAYVYIDGQNYSIGLETNSSGYFYADLVNGIYDISVSSPGFSFAYFPEAFEVNNGAVTFNINVYEFDYAGPPEIVDLHDVPNDQGRQMRAVWHSGEPGGWEYFTQFSIWRKVVDVPFDLWDYVETIPWHGLHNPYAAVVPTLGDSSSNEFHQSTFIVTAHTQDVDFYVDSEPATGWSIDNIHPSVPMNLVMSNGPGTVSLNWLASDDVDFDYYNVYRQSIASNEPAMVFTTIDSFYIDTDMSQDDAYQYWVTTVDQSGLESEASSIVSAVLAADDNLGMPTEFALKQNYPNPFNPSTQIQYALPSETRVVISIYDITGRKVRTLVNEVQSPGYKNVLWNATNEIGRPVSAGMYIYSIQAGDFIQNKKMVLMK